MKSFLEYKLNEGLGVPEKIVFDKSFVVNGKASAGISIRDVIVTRKTGFTPYIKLIELTSVGGGGWGPESPRENDMKTIWKGDLS